MYAYLIIIMLLVLFGLASCGIGVIYGVTYRKKLSKKVKAKADTFTKEVLYGEGASDDKLEPDDFEKKKQERTVNDDKTFFS